MSTRAVRFASIRRSFWVDGPGDDEIAEGTTSKEANLWRDRFPFEVSPEYHLASLHEDLRQVLGDRQLSHKHPQF